MIKLIKRKLDPWMSILKKEHYDYVFTSVFIIIIIWNEYK